MQIIKLAIAPAIASCAGTPQLGCYKFDMGDDSVQVEAQIEIQSASTLEFSVYINVPGLFNDVTIVCPNEQFGWDEASSTMSVGAGSLSPCLTALKDHSRGLVSTPIPIVYNSAAMKLETNIVLPVSMAKMPSCKTFTPSGLLPIAPTTTAATAESGPAVPNGPVSLNDVTTTTTRSAYTAASVTSFIIATLVVVLM